MKNELYEEREARVMNNTLSHHGILGMKWGVRRYQNKDGTLTEAGKARLKKDTLRNEQKKHKDRLPTEALNDPNRWIKEDLENKRQLTNSASNLLKQIQTIERETRPKPANKRMDLSQMTDQELRQRINRELTERQYNDLFGEKEVSVSKGRKHVNQILEIAGGALAVSSSALSIALAIKQLKG